MAESPANRPEDASGTESLDLSALRDLSFGPDWASGEGKRSAGKGPPRDREGGARGAPGRDRRPPRNDRRPPRGGGRDAGDRRPSGSGRDPRDRRPPPEEEFEPVVDVDLYPQDEAFDALVARLRASARTYQLFEIALLLLEKPERFNVVVSNKPVQGDDGTTVPPLFAAGPENLPFASEEEGFAYVLQNHLDHYFEIEETEVDPPKGNFPMVNRCTVTGELLGPPNYHRYQEFVQQHYAAKIHGMAFERYQSKIESVREQEAVDAWLEKMKKGVRYIVKDRAEGEPEAFETLESARQFLQFSRKDRLLRSFESVRFAGKDIAKLPRGEIRRSIEVYHQRQLRFPLDTANNIRGRLRRHKFTVYKKGSKGVSFVCAVKRKFRTPETVFTDSIQGLIAFIENNGMIRAAELPKAYLGIEVPPKGGEGDAPGDGVAPDAASGEGERIKQLTRDLRWLVSEGYVTEYGDGKLFAPPPQEAPKKRPAAAAAPKEAAGEPVAGAAEAPAPDTAEEAGPVAEEAGPVVSEAEATADEKKPEAPATEEPEVPAEEENPEASADRETGAVADEAAGPMKNPPASSKIGLET